MITVQGLTKRYRTRLAVDRLSFTVIPGRVTGFLGPNGSGKSTTMRMILGLDTPTGGRAEVGGCQYRALPHPLRRVGSLLDAAAVHPGRTAQSHLRWIAASNDIPASRIPQVLEDAGLTTMSRRRIGSYSLGMRQRLAIAGALLGDPPVLIFDEPINGLDPEGIHWIRTLMKCLAAEGRTVFVASHLMSEMALTADNLIIIGQGRLLADTSVADFLAASAPGDVLVRSPHASLLAQLLRSRGGCVTTHPDGGLAVTGLSTSSISALAANHRIAVHELTQRQASLEQAYMQLTNTAVQLRAGHSPVSMPLPAERHTR